MRRARAKVCAEQILTLLVLLMVATILVLGVSVAARDLWLTILILMQ